MVMVRPGLEILRGNRFDRRMSKALCVSGYDESSPGFYSAYAKRRILIVIHAYIQCLQPIGAIYRDHIEGSTQFPNNIPRRYAVLKALVCHVVDITERAGCY